MKCEKKQLQNKYQPVVSGCLFGLCVYIYVIVSSRFFMISGLVFKDYSIRTSEFYPIWNRNSLLIVNMRFWDEIKKQTQRILDRVVVWQPREKTLNTWPEGATLKSSEYLWNKIFQTNLQNNDTHHRTQILWLWISVCSAERFRIAPSHISEIVKGISTQFPLLKPVKSWDIMYQVLIFFRSSKVSSSIYMTFLL